MTKMILRSPSTEAFNTLAVSNTSTTLLALIPNFLICGVLISNQFCMLKKQSECGEMELTVTTVVVTVLTTALTTLFSGLMLLIYAEFRTAANSRKNNQAIGYAIETDSPEEVRAVQKIRDIPYSKISIQCPTITCSKPREEFINHLIVEGENQLIDVSYRLEEVTDLKLAGWLLAFSHTPFFLGMILASYPQPKNVFAGMALLGTILSLITYVELYSFPRLLKASVSAFDSCSPSPFSGRFFAKQLNEFRQIENEEGNELRNPLLV